jgi:hypothetical protein
MKMPLIFVALALLCLPVSCRTAFSDSSLDDLTLSADPDLIGEWQDDDNNVAKVSVEGARYKIRYSQRNETVVELQALGLKSSGGRYLFVSLLPGLKTYRYQEDNVWFPLKIKLAGDRLEYSMLDESALSEARNIAGSRYCVVYDPEGSRREMCGDIVGIKFSSVIESADGQISLFEKSGNHFRRMANAQDR